MSTAVFFASERIALLNSRALRADVLEVRGLTRDFTDESYTPDLQVVVPLQGVHYLASGRSEVLVDLNQMVMIPADIATRDRHPSAGDVACLIITPAPDVLEELWHGTGVSIASLQRDGCSTRPTTPRIQHAGALLRFPERLRDILGEAHEEVLLSIARRAASDWSRTPVRLGGRSLALVRAAKELMATAQRPLSLTETAQEVGASPAYLTDLFRRAEGMPLYRYQLRLRLASALRRLPEIEDITGLALDLGFSSHSHFSAAFRAAYGVSPSMHRSQARQAA